MIVTFLGTSAHFLSCSPGYGVVSAPRLHFYASSGTVRMAAQLLERDCVPLGLLDPEVGERLNTEIHHSLDKIALC
jgi:hypothetical protein